jgi:hypothetical protein
MTPRFHPGLSVEKWRSYPYSKQLLNIASELMRTRKWLRENDANLRIRSLERAFDLIDLTVSANQGKKPLRELLRLREVLGAFYIGESQAPEEFDFLFNGLIQLDKDCEALGIVL